MAMRKGPLPDPPCFQKIQGAGFTGRQCRGDFQGQEEMEARAIGFLSAAENIKGLKLLNTNLAMTYRLSMGFLAGVIMTLPSLTVFELSGFELGFTSKSTDSLVRQLLESLSMCPHLTHLHLKFENVQMKSPLSPKLRFGNLKEVYLDNVHVSDDALLSLLVQSPVLATLVIECDSVLLERPRILSASLLKLEMHLVGLDGPSFDELTIVCPKLAHLHTPMAAKMVITAPELRTLALLRYAEDEGPLIWEVVPWKVQKLLIQGDGKWELDDFTKLCDLCPDLVDLTMNDIYGICESIDPGVLARTCKEIRKLYIHSSLISSTSDSIANSTDEFTRLLRFDKLKYLKVRIGDREDDVDRCIKMVSLCPNLETLEGQVSAMYVSDSEDDEDPVEDRVPYLEVELKRISPTLNITIKTVLGSLTHETDNLCDLESFEQLMCKNMVYLKAFIRCISWWNTDFTTLEDSCIKCLRLHGKQCTIMYLKGRFHNLGASMSDLCTD